MRSLLLCTLNIKFKHWERVRLPSNRGEEQVILIACKSEATERASCIVHTELCLVIELNT